MDLETMDSYFQDLENIENIPVDRNVLHLLARHGSLTADELKVAYEKSAIYPPRKEWLFAIHRFFMAAGVLLLLSGIVFFFAYNWSGLHKFSKLALAEGGIIAVGLGLLFFKPSDFILKLGLTAISVLVGIAFAVFGQIYQTGADAYDFFLGWTIFVTAWVAISSFPFLWLFYLLLINLTAHLYLVQVQMVYDETMLLLLAVLLNVPALLIWEYRTLDFRERWDNLFCVRTLGTAVVIAVTALMLDAIFDSSFSIYQLLYVIVVVLGGVFYTKTGKDIAFVTMLAISVLVVVNAFIIDCISFRDSEIALFFFLSFMNIGATVGLVFTLMRLHKSWTLEKSGSNE